MKCLVCKDVDLAEYEIEPGLIVHNCCKCGGNWLRMTDYLKWLNNPEAIQKERKEEGIEEQENLIVNDSKNQKLCPDCRTILSSYKAASNIKFKIERCDACNGIWLDKNEWEILKQNNLHMQIDKIFTFMWQRKIKEEERKEYFDDFYINKFGKEDYNKIKEVKVWLDNNKNKSLLLSFLIKNDPYKF